MNSTNDKLFEVAKQYIPGGVNSPVRSFNAVGGVPFFTVKAQDCYLYDKEGKQYIDYICSWGANIVGHANSYIIEKVVQALHNGFSYGTPTELEVELAKQINNLMPSIEKFRLVSSGTEAVMSAIRLARGYTNKRYLIKFNGCYHGHSNNLLVSAGSGLATFNQPNSKGVLPSDVKYTLGVEYNNVDQLTQAFTKYGNDIAGVIIEPFAGNMNLVRPTAKFLSILRQLCDEYNSLLIFDEVMTGFRVSLGGAQAILGIKPDLTTLGKVIGGGMPLAGLGGKAEIMDYLAPLGGVYQAGTLSGNPIAVTAGLATLELIQKPNFYENLTSLTKQLTNGLIKLAHQYQIPFTSDYIGGMFGIYFAPSIPTNFSEAKQCNQLLFNQFFQQMLTKGIYFAPSMYEAGFICAKHTPSIINDTLIQAETVFNAITK